MATKRVRRTRRRRQEDPGTLISGGPPPVDEEEDTRTSEPAPLGGMPRSYRVAPGPGTPGYYPHGFNYNTRSYGQDAPGGIGPRYVDGDEWRPSSIGSAGIKQLQRAMITAGLVSDVRWGRWTIESAKAYAQVLGYANARGITDQMALAELVDSQMISAGGGGGEGAGGGGGSQIVGFDESGEPIYAGYVAPPLEVKTTNKDDLRSLFRRAVIDIRGEGWSQAQIDELVDAYNWQEIRVQKDAYDRQVALERSAFEQGEGAISGAVVTAESVPSPEAFVENEMMRRDPVGTQAGKVVNEAIPQFLQIVGGWG